MLDDMGLIHMNGRVYDPRLARFLQADPFIQAATNTQSYNRYSYLWNNPLNATDPSGFFLKKLWKKIKPFVGMIVGAVLCLYAACVGAEGVTAWGLAASMASGGIQAAVNGGNIIDGIVIGALTPMLGGGGGGWVGFMTRGVGSGMISVAMGGKFGHGFASAGLNQAFSGLAGQYSGLEGLIVNAVIGGTISEMTGGKFANGAATAAFSYAMTWAASKYAPGGEVIEENGGDTTPASLEKFIKNKEFSDNFSVDPETGALVFSATVSASADSRELLHQFINDVNSSYGSIEVDGRKLSVRLSASEGHGSGDADIYLRTRNEWRKSDPRGFNKFIETSRGKCLTACATTGGRIVTIGSAKNAGQYTHELFHMMGFRHESSAQSIMYGSFAQSEFRTHGVHAYHIDKLNSVYGL